MQLRSSLTVYSILGVSTFTCASGLNRFAWHAAQSGLKPGAFHTMTSLFVVWQLAQFTLAP